VETWFFPFLIAGMTLITRNSEVAIHLVSVLAGSLLPIPMYFLGLQMYGLRVARIVACLAVFFPLAIALSVTGYTENLHLTLLPALIYAMFRCFDPAPGRWWLWTGLLAGCTYLNRTEAFVFPFFLVFFLVVAALFRKENLKKPILISIKVLLVFSVFVAGYATFFRIQSGHFRIEGKNNLNYTMGRRVTSGITPDYSAFGIDQDANEYGALLDQNRYVNYTPYPAGFRDLLHYFFIRAAWNKFWIYDELLPNFTIGAPFLTFLSFLGLFASAWSLRRLGQEVLLFCFVAYICVLLLASHAHLLRYCFPLLPFGLLWSSKGLETLYNWALRTAEGVRNHLNVPSRPFAAFVAVVPAIGMIVFSVAGVRDASEFAAVSLKEIPFKEAAVWLRAHSPENKYVMGSGEFIFYSGGLQYINAYADAQLELRYIHKKKPDYLVLDELRDIHRPYTKDWLDHGIPDPQAKLVYATGTTPNRVVVYQWAHSPDPRSALK